MGKIFLISDLHLGHEGMALHRSFKSVEEHDNYIIEQWNSVVKKKDTVWVLGDITMEKTFFYYKLDLLNGYKKVVMGNHDMCKRKHNEELLNYINAMCGTVVNKRKGYILSHIPIHPSELFDCINIHGHVHENTIDDKRYINVSCENVNYIPIQLDYVLDRKRVGRF